MLESREVPTEPEGGLLQAKQSRRGADSSNRNSSLYAKMQLHTHCKSSKKIQSFIKKKNTYPIA